LKNNRHLHNLVLVLKWVTL